MLSTQKRLFAAIEKVEEQDDGTLKVYGYASSEAEDSEGETITADAMKAALPDYMKWGAVREMHQSTAAGTAIEAKVEDDGRTAFAAHVVDPVAIKKVQTQTYKGFSIGGKVTKRDPDNKKIIQGLKLVEVSLVDRPANPEAVFTCYKAEVSEPTAEEAIDSIAKMLNDKQITPQVLLKAGKAAVTSREKIRPDEVKKGMYSLQTFASLLATIGYLAQDTQAEAEWEGDSSPLPAQLKDWLAAGIMIFENMTAEETSELLATLKAAAPTDLNKAGAKFSTSTKAALKAAHDACKAADKALADLAYDKDDDKDGDSDKGEKVEKTKAEVTPDPVAKPEATDIEKSLGTELAKRDQQIADLLKATTTLTQEVDALKKQPLPGKALLMAIGKGEDIGQRKEPTVEPITKADGSVDEAATLIKAVHAKGGTPVRF